MRVVLFTDNGAARRLHVFMHLDMLYACFFPISKQGQVQRRTSAVVEGLHRLR